MFAELHGKQALWAERAAVATPRAAHALDRLLHLAETRRSGQIERVALFLGAVWNGLRHFDLYDLRALDVEILDDMLAVLDGLRWGRVAIPEMVPDGGRLIQSVLTALGYVWRRPDEPISRDPRLISTFAQRPPAPG